MTTSHKTRQKSVEKTIRNFRSKLQEYENKEIVKLNKRQKQLLQDVLYVHNKVEKGLNLCITLKTVSPISANKKTLAEDLYTDALKHIHIAYLADQLSFRRKLEVAKKFDILNNKDVNHLNKLNDLRNNFAHFKSMKILDTDEYYTQNYELLVRAIHFHTILVALTISKTGMSPSPSEYGL